MEADTVLLACALHVPALASPPQPLPRVARVPGSKVDDLAGACSVQQLCSRLASRRRPASHVPQAKAATACTHPCCNSPHRLITSPMPQPKIIPIRKYIQPAANAKLAQIRLGCAKKAVGATGLKETCRQLTEA